MWPPRAAPNGYHNRWFLDPLYGRGYPADMLDHSARILPHRPHETCARCAVRCPGGQLLRPTIIRAPIRPMPFLGARSVQDPHEAVTQMDWIVRPSSLRQLLGRLHRDYPVGAAWR